ncbi:acyltransferase [Acidisphaera sp. S103]|uniref:acyltransferase family protein n=1 Tax=Acidisphaera sp. S103 TaxID=1747223 RepID=UPI00131E95E1|nr:acyltransferase [Acidisphaera sp. S103]
MLATNQPVPACTAPGQTGSIPQRPRPQLFPWVQALRAVAAAAVAFVHIGNDAMTAGRDPAGLIAKISAFLPWAAGVDVFFVISGFVIVHASTNLFAQPGGSVRFLYRRLTRIVPLYWVLTTLFLATTLLQRSAIHGETGGSAYVLASYLFIPWARPDGLVEPALGLGWTLNYEMFFYLVMTPFLLLPRTRAVTACAALLCLLVTIGRIVGPTSVPLRYWSDPIVLEFILGMGLALAVARGLTLPGWVRIVLVGVAIAWLHQQVDAWRIGSFGLPGALLVAAAVSGRRPGRIGPVEHGLIRLGDASYAMYLFHPFVMRGFTLLGARIGTRTETSGLVYVVTALVAAQLCALAINAGFERRLTNRLRRNA